MNWCLITTFIGTIILLSACAETLTPTEKSLDKKLSAVIEKRELTGKPTHSKPISDIYSPMAQLGKKLFFSRLLSGQKDAACATCHQPILGGGDGRSLPIGVDAVDPDVFGPARMHSPNGFGYDGGPTVPRNAQSTFNVIFYDRCLFWDCRVESLGATTGMGGEDGQGIRTPDSAFGIADENSISLLQAQAGFPPTSAEEMRARFMSLSSNDVVRQELALRFQQNSATWLEAFQIAFNSTGSARQLITFKNISTAIAAYEASQVFTNNPWKSYVEGYTLAISASAKRGALLFLQTKEEGGAGCFNCHSGDFFTDEQFHVVAMLQVGRGKGDGVYKDADYGRYRETKNPDDKYAFRTPTLLNVEVSGPYGHAGAYTDLKDVIRHMTNPKLSFENTEIYLRKLDSNIQKQHAIQNTQDALNQLNILFAENKSNVTLFETTPQMIDDIYEFLLTLTDPCVKSESCLTPWM